MGYLEKHSLLITLLFVSPLGCRQPLTPVLNNQSTITVKGI